MDTPETISSSNKTAVIIILIVLLIFVILLIIVSFLWLSLYIYNNNHRAKTIILLPGVQAKPKPVLPKLSMDGTAGASGSGHYLYAGSGLGLSSCSGDRAFAKPDGSCYCYAPYWGQKCELESYPKTMTAIGWLNDPYSAYNWGPSYRFEGQKTAMECSRECEKRSDCVGFVQDDQGYTLITQPPLLTEVPTYDPLKPVNLYLKNQVRPKFIGVMYLYQGTLPKRFWTSPRLDVITLNVNQPRQLPFMPTNWINDGDLRLSYSRSYFTNPDEAEYIMTSNFSLSQEWISSWWFMAHL